MPHRLTVSTFIVCALAFACLAGPGRAEEVDVKAFFAKAAADGRSGMAEKTKAVDARPATPGEVVVTIIKSEGVETKSKPAEAGDMVVRNRCPQTGNEEYLVKAATFAKRYGAATGPADPSGFRPFTPVGAPMRFVIMKASEGPFTFKAPWGEDMVAKPADAIVQDPGNPADTYRIAAAAFACTYAVTKEPGA